MWGRLQSGSQTTELQHVNELDNGFFLCAAYNSYRKQQHARATPPQAMHKAF